MSRTRGRTPKAEELYSGLEAAERAGVTYRQFNYWADKQWLRPSLVKGATRYFDARELLKAAILGRAGDLGLKHTALFDDQKSMAAVLAGIITELEALEEAARANYL